MLCCCAAPPPPPPTGACCQDGGACVELSEAQCIAAEGDYQGDGTTCTPNPCPADTEACCLPDGTCRDTRVIRCTALGGTSQGPGTTCAGVDCPQPVAACCFPDGSCQDLTQLDCANQNGVWQGLGTDCVGTVCPEEPGACCHREIPGQLKICENLTEALCQGKNEPVWTPNIDCADVFCDCLDECGTGGAEPAAVLVALGIPSSGVTPFEISPVSQANAVAYLNGLRSFPIDPVSGFGVCQYRTQTTYPDDNFEPGYVLRLTVEISIICDDPEVYMETTVIMENQAAQLAYQHRQTYRSNPAPKPQNANGWQAPGTIPPGGRPNFEETIAGSAPALGQGSVTVF